MKVLSITAKNNQFAGFDSQEVEIELEDGNASVYVSACDNEGKLYALTDESIFSDSDMEQIECFDKLEDTSSSKYAEDYAVADKVLAILQDYIASKDNG